MTHFAYRAAGAGGRWHSGQIEAVDETAALEALRRQGLVATELRAAPKDRPRRISGRRAGQLTLELTERLAILLGAGIRLDRALQLMGDMATGPAADIAADILTAVRRGDGLSAALARRPDVFDDEFISMVAAGESSGTTAASLNEIAVLRRTRQQDAARLRAALSYPLFLVLVALLVLYLLTAMVLPRFRPFFEGTRREPPAELMAMFAIGDFMQAAFLPAAFIGFAILLGIMLGARQPTFRARLDALLLRLPMLGGVLVQYASARFATTLAAQVAHGVPIGQALRNAALVLDNAAFRTAGQRAAAAVQEGMALSDALAREPVFPAILVQLVRLGEETNQLADLLIRTGRITEQSARQSIQRLERVLAPALTLFVGAMVGVVILVVFHAVQSLYTLV